MSDAIHVKIKDADDAHAKIIVGFAKYFVFNTQIHTNTHKYKKKKKNEIKSMRMQQVILPRRVKTQNLREDMLRL